MSEQIIFISTHKIKEGKFEGLKEYTREGMKRIEEEKPGTVVFLAYTNEDGSEVKFVHVFPNKEAMEQHWEGAGDRAQAALELIEPQRFEFYGDLPEAIRDWIQGVESRGMAVSVMPELLGGYIR